MAKSKKDKINNVQWIIFNENNTYDLKNLLKNEKYDNKPNMAKFLKTYVKSIRICIKESKVDLWPKIHYDIGKSIIRLKDDTTLIKDSHDNFYIFNDLIEQDISDSLKSLLEKFFEYLEKFRFIRNGHEDVKVFSTDVEKTNAELSAQINCVKEKEIQQFIDYTPKISVNCCT